MKNNYLVTLVFLFCCTELRAFPCYFTLVKDNCWTNYTVTVSILDPSNDHYLSSIEVPKGKSWGRQLFNCEPGQKLLFTARFSPTIWQGMEKKVYRATHYWTAPEKINTEHKAWNIQVCFPKAFSEVPVSAEETGNCSCDLKAIPALKSSVNKPL